ncbi:MAG: lysylphosphatidylglycerol synthase domain-containing protein, partial [Myxococcota bacterium]
REAFAETGLATLLNQLLPSGVAGEVARIWRQRHPQRATSDVVAAALTDRGLGFATFVAALTLSLIAWPWLHPGTPPLLPIGAALALTVGGAMLLAVPSAVPAVGPVIHAIRRATTDRRTTTVLVSASVAFLAAILAQALVCAWALGLPGGLGLLGLLPLYLLSMLVPLSVGGWGPKEVAAVSLFPLLGWSAADAAAFSTVFGLTTLLGAAVFAPVALFRRRTP